MHSAIAASCDFNARRKSHVLCSLCCLVFRNTRSRSLPLVAAAAAAALSLSLLLLFIRLLSLLLLLLLLLLPLLLLQRHRQRDTETERDTQTQTERQKDGHARDRPERPEREEKTACLKGLHVLLVIDSVHPVHSNHLTAQYCSPQRTKLLKPCAASERQYSCPAGPLRRKWLVCTNNSCKIGVLKSTGRKARGPS